MGKVPLLKTNGTNGLEPYDPNQYLISRPTPTSDTHVANKAYVDAQIGANDTLQEITDNGATTTNEIGVASIEVTGNGTVGEPSVKVGGAENGFYQVTSTQLGASIGDALVATIEDDGIHADATFLRVAVGTPGTGVTAVHYGDGKNITTYLTLSGIELTIAGAADEAVGALIWTFPAGVHAHEVTSMNVTLTGGGTVDADTPDVGIGSAQGTGAVALLSGTATFEDYVTGQTATDCSGTAIPALTAATAGYGTGISLNQSGDTKTMYLNVADGWAGADTITLAGTVRFKWTIL